MVQDCLVVNLPSVDDGLSNADALLCGDVLGKLLARIAPDPTCVVVLDESDGPFFSLDDSTSPWWVTVAQTSRVLQRLDGRQLYVNVVWEAMRDQDCPKCGDPNAPPGWIGSPHGRLSQFSPTMAECMNVNVTHGACRHVIPWHPERNKSVQKALRSMGRDLQPEWGCGDGGRQPPSALRPRPLRRRSTVRPPRCFRFFFVLALHGAWWVRHPR